MTSDTALPLSSEINLMDNTENKETSRGENKDGRPFRWPKLSLHYHRENIFKSKTVKTAFICSLIFNFIFVCGLIATIIVIIFFPSQSLQPLALSSLSRVVCYPCAKAGIPGIRNQVRAENGYCCVNRNDKEFGRINKSNMIPRVSALMGRYVTPEECKEYLNPNKTKKGGRHDIQIAARLELDTDSMKQKKSNGLKWLTGFLQGAVDFVNGTMLCLREGGLVNIVSHFSFDTYNKKPKQDAVIVRHVVFKVTNTTYKKLAYENVSLKQRTYRSSHLEVTERFLTNDCVGVYVSTPSAVYDLPVANIFQIVKVGELVN